jgi:sirohydrochlorin ferrochelatase
VAVGHGSRDPRAAAVAGALLTRVRALRPGLDVREAYLDFTAPSAARALADVDTAGHAAAVLVPLLLTEAFHTRVDVPAVVAAAAATLPRLSLVQAAALGPHPLLLAAAERRLAEAGVVAGDPDVAVVMAAAGTSNADALEVLRGVAAGWARRGWWGVEPAYASASAPTVAEAVASLRERGAPRVAVSPYVLAPGILPDRIVAGAAGADFVAAPLGACDDVARVVLERYDAAAPALP